MKRNCLIWTACFAAVACQAQLIDDFSTAGLGEYTFTRVLDNGIAEANVSLSDASGALGASYAGTINQPEQVVLLRSDSTLGVGYMLIADVLFPTQASQMDFGIAVSTTATPTGVAGITTDTRGTFNWTAVYVRPSGNNVRSLSSIDGTIVSATGVLTADETTVGQLFIERNSSTLFTLGYYNTSGTRFVSRTATFTATDVGTALGFYADLRAAGGTLGNLDNLRISVIPEPSLVTLLGLGFIGLISRLRQSNLKT